MTVTIAAVDLGATSGRVMRGVVGPGILRLEPVARFDNAPVSIAGGLHWNVLELYRQVLSGLGNVGPVASIGVDSWAVDYALLRGERMLGMPFHYRDERTAEGVQRVHSVLPHAALYARTGLQFLPFTTLYQLAADDLLPLADRALLIPDLIAFWLTGQARTEVTNASTTGLLRPDQSGWDAEVCDPLGVDAAFFAPLVRPGETVGNLLPSVAEATGLDRSTPVVAVGSHDTASAVVAVPMTDPDAAYISCGTWGLVGLELDHPVMTDAAREANFTHEGGVDGRIRFLHNVMGLWLLSESVRTWERESAEDIDLPRLLAAAAEAPAGGPEFDVDDAVFLAPGDMPERITTWLRERGLPVPTDRAAMTRCIIDSLASAFARTVHTAATLAARRVRVIHLVGGGALNDLLCQATADRAGMPVLAGPVEATALGNVLVQARALGAAPADLEGLRSLVARTTPPRQFVPRAQPCATRISRGMPEDGGS